MKAGATAARADSVNSATLWSFLRQPAVDGPLEFRTRRPVVPDRFDVLLIAGRRARGLLSRMAEAEHKALPPHRVANGGPESVQGGPSTFALFLPGRFCRASAGWTQGRDVAST